MLTRFRIQLTRRLRRLLQRLQKAHATPRRRGADSALLPVPQDAGEERPLGCGWFDSSHELERGLLVQEADDTALSALPLNDWLALQQRGVVLAADWALQPA